MKHPVLLLAAVPLALAEQAALTVPAHAQCSVTPLDGLEADPGNPNALGGVGGDVAVLGDLIAVSGGEKLFPFQSPDPFDGAVWILEPDPADPGDWVVVDKVRGPFASDVVAYGYRVVLTGADTLLVSAPGPCVGDCVPNGSSGTVFVYERGPNGFELAQTLTAPVPTENDLFGVSMAHEEGVLVVASPFDAAAFPGSFGAIHVYERTPSGFELRTSLQSGARHVDLADGLLAAAVPAVPLIGAFPGEASAFRMGATPADWTHLATFDPDPTDRAPDLFGHSVATNGSAVLVGVLRGNITVDPFAIPGQEPGMSDSGRIDVFEDTGSGWAKTARLAAPVPEVTGRFGEALVASGDRVVVGSPRASEDPDAQGLGLGRVLVLERRDGLWAPVDAIDPNALGVDPLAIAPGLFGAELAADGGRLVVSAPSSDGAVSVLDLDGPACDERRLLGAPGLVSLEKGGEHVLATKGAGVADGGVYVVLGSLSGTEPGIDVGALHVPLNPDAYLDLTVLKPNTAPLVATLGLLDAESEGTSALAVSPATDDPSLVGLEIHHATALFAPPAFELVHVTEPARLALVP